MHFVLSCYVSELEKSEENLRVALNMQTQLQQKSSAHDAELKSVQEALKEATAALTKARQEADAHKLKVEQMETEVSDLRLDHKV